MQIYVFHVASLVYTQSMVCVCACVFQHTLSSMENHFSSAIKNSSKSENLTGKRKLAEIKNRFGVTAQCHLAALSDDI